jgi:hypothetical protein
MREQYRRAGRLAREIRRDGGIIDRHAWHAAGEQHRDKEQRASHSVPPVQFSILVALNPE